MDQDLLAKEADVFNALAHPARLEILDLLRRREACVCHIQAMSSQRQSYISQQLNVLRQADLVTSRKDGQWTFYSVYDPKLFDVIDQVKTILQDLGKWPGEASNETGAAAPQVTCSCPQCSAGAGSQGCVPAGVSCA